MIIAYRKSDLKIMSTSGINSGGDPPGEWEIETNIVPNFGGVAADYGFIWVADATARACYSAASFELTFDAQGNPTGVITYPRLTASVNPNPAAVNATVTVTATLPVGTPDTTVTFQVEGGTIYTEPVTTGQASHAYAFAAAGRCRIICSSAHHGSAVVEVTVQ